MGRKGGEFQFLARFCQADRKVEAAQAEAILSGRIHNENH